MCGSCGVVGAWCRWRGLLVEAFGREGEGEGDLPALAAAYLVGFQATVRITQVRSCTETLVRAVERPMGHDSMTDVQLDVDRGEQKLIVCLSSGQGQK